VNQPTFDEIGIWSEVKLEIIRKYAAAYSTVLTRQRGIQRHLYIDAFAGAGTHVSRRTGEMVPGSPRNALLVQPPFAEYHFIDMDGTRAEELRRIGKGNPRVFVHEGDCNELLLDRVFPRCRYQERHRALCLLDPYALNLEWRVLQAAGEAGSIEVFYNFMIMDANRNVLWRNPARVRNDQSARMDSAWGDHTWREVLYTRSPGLFGEIEEKAENDVVAEALRHRLEKVAGFKYVPRPIPMKDSAGRVFYYLFFASPNKTGARIVGEIFDKHRM
jgi:three-Cys-motif partner protein